MHLDLLNGTCLTARKGVGGSKSTVERRKSLVMILLRDEGIRLGGWSTGIWLN
jgi:hypothetical protein